MQLFEHSGNMTVIMGGGRRHFYENSDEDGRADGNDFISAWKNDPDVKYVETQEELFRYQNDGMKEKLLVGLFSEGHMEYEVDREKDAPSEPSLYNMTEAAIRKLSENPNG